MGSAGTGERLWRDVRFGGERLLRILHVGVRAGGGAVAVDLGPARGGAGSPEGQPTKVYSLRLRPSRFSGPLSGVRDAEVMEPTCGFTFHDRPPAGRVCRNLSISAQAVAGARCKTRCGASTSLISTSGRIDRIVSQDFRFTIASRLAAR